MILDDPFHQHVVGRRRANEIEGPTGFHMVFPRVIVEDIDVGIGFAHYMRRLGGVAYRKSFFGNNAVEEEFLVRVINVVNNYNDKAEEGNALIAQCENAPRNKIFVGKAELGDYFAELDKKRKREEITQKLEERFKEAEKMALYQKLAETDPEMKELLTELEALK